MFRIQEHLHTIFADVAPGYDIAIADSHDEVYRRGQAESDFRPGLAVEKSVRFYSATWVIRIWPSLQQLARESSPFPKVALGVGLLIALLVPSIVYLAQTARLQAAQLGTANQELQRRLALGQTDVLEARPLIYAGRDQHDTSKRLASACHLGVD